MEQKPFESNYPRDFSPSGKGTNRFRGMPPGIYIDWIGTAWEYIKSNMGMYAVATLVFFAVTSIGQIPYQIVSFGMNLGPDNKGISFYALFVPLMFITYVISFAVQTLMTAGFVLFALDHVDGKELNIGRMFDPFKRIGHTLMAAIMSSLGMLVGFILCIVPGFYVYGRWFFATILAADQGLTWKESMNMSWERTQSFAWMMLVLILVSGLVSLLGFLACCIGILVTYPIMMVMYAMHYRVIFQEFGDGDQVNPMPMS
jgi:uncharacterized membrane protein